MKVICLLILYISISVAYPSGPWSLKTQFKGSASDYQKDKGKSLIENWWIIDKTDSTHGFPDAYKNANAGGPNLYIDSAGYLVIQPTCPVPSSAGGCKAFQCGDKMINNQVCQCNDDTIKNKYFPWWCQLGWTGAKIASRKTFSVNKTGGILIFEDVRIPKGKPLWPAIWLLPYSNPVFGGNGSPKGGNFDIWPNNGELDILETVGDDPRIYGTFHYSSGNEYNGWPGVPVTANSSAVKGTAYVGKDLNGNILALRNSGDNPTTVDGQLGSLCFMWYVDDNLGPVFSWFVSDTFPIDASGNFNPKQQVDVMINRKGTNPLFGGITGDGSGALSFGTTPYWPGSRGNSPPLTLYKGWDGKNAYGYQGYYPVQGNVRTTQTGIHNGPVSSANPKGLGIVPKFSSNGTALPNTIDQLFEPHLCSMIGDWANPLPFPWATTTCQNPPAGSQDSNCPMDGKGPADSYDYCMVEGAKKPGVGWWSNSPLAKGVPFAPFDTTQNWNIMLNVAIGGDWPRAAGQEGGWAQDFGKILQTNLKMKSISYYEMN